MKINDRFFIRGKAKHQGSLKDALLTHSHQMQWVGKGWTSSGNTGHAQFLISECEPHLRLSRGIPPSELLPLGALAILVVRVAFIFLITLCLSFYLGDGIMSYRRKGVRSTSKNFLVAFE